MSDFTTEENGLTSTLSLSAVPGMDSVLAFGMPKAGSSMLMKILKDICEVLGQTVVDFPSFCFQSGFDPKNAPVADIFKLRGYVYVGFCTVTEKITIPILHDVKGVLLVRNPRDCVTSLYYSVASSDTAPAANSEHVPGFWKSREQALGQDINAFALERIATYVERLENCDRLWRDIPGMKLLYYEENVYMKVRLIKRILSHFGWKPDNAAIFAIARRYDIRPEGEDPQRHARQVHPGNCLGKLSEDTIARINVDCAKTLRLYSYA